MTRLKFRLQLQLSNGVSIGCSLRELMYSVKEGLFLFEHTQAPYDGGVYHQAPLLLALLSTIHTILPLEAHRLGVAVLYATADMWSAHCLRRISAQKFASNSSKSESASFDISLHIPWITFLFSPLTFASTISLSSFTFTISVTLSAIMYAVQKKTAAAAFSLAMASYLSLYPVLLLPSLILIISDGPNRRTIFTILFWFTSTTILLFYSSYMLLGSWNFLEATYGVILLLPDLTPNLGLWWYFFIEMFDAFRSFWLVVFQLHLCIYVFPLCIKLKQRPLYAATIMCGLISIIKSYPSVSDLVLFHALLSLHIEIFKHMRYLFMTTSALLYAAFLAPTFYHLWIISGSGNANFFYAITLVYGLAQSIFVTDALYAMMFVQWLELEKPDLTRGDVQQVF